MLILSFPSHSLTAAAAPSSVPFVSHLLLLQSLFVRSFFVSLFALVVSLSRLYPAQSLSIDRSFANTFNACDKIQRYLLRRLST